MNQTAVRRNYGSEVARFRAALRTNITTLALVLLSALGAAVLMPSILEGYVGLVRWDAWKATSQLTSGRTKFDSGAAAKFWLASAELKKEFS